MAGARRWAIALALLLAACSDGADLIPLPGTMDAGVDTTADRFPASDFGGDAPAARRPFTVVVLPDTQFYSGHYPDVFEAQTRWIAEQATALHIGFVLHEGDIVDRDWPGQWAAARRSLQRLDGVVPYVLAAGNHDLGVSPMGLHRMGMINTYFPVAKFASQPWFQGTFEPNDIQNSHALFEVGGQRWQVLALEFAPRDQVLSWALATLQRNPDVPAIIVTHAYLYEDGTRYDFATRKDQLFSPYAYGLERLPGGVNDGEQMWQKLVVPSRNVRFVLSGHVIPKGVARLTSQRPDGSRVHQLLANYQTVAECPCDDIRGGNGYLRVMEFAASGRQVAVRTYSPYLDRFKDDPDNQFLLELDR